MKFWIGTSGFQYAEWKRNFYPEDLPAAQMLSFYADRFSTTEINYTFHRIPAPKTIENWKTLTPENFRFALKAPQKITHWSKLRDSANPLEYFLKVAGGLGERLGPPKKITADYGYLRLRREDYQKTDIGRWADFVREQEAVWKDAFVYFKHEESGIGPKLAKQMTELLG